MSEFAIGKRIEVVDSGDSGLFPNGSTGIIVAKDVDYSDQSWWVKFDEGCGAVTDSGNNRYTNQTGDKNFHGVWSVNEWEIKTLNEEDSVSGYIETGRKMRKEWEPDQVREDVDLMQSIRDACGG